MRIDVVFQRQHALAIDCLRIAWRSGFPLDTIAALTDGASIVRLRPDEFARFALAVAQVRHAQQRRCRA